MSKLPDKGLTGVSPAALSWLTGSWLGTNGVDHVEEHWSPLVGNTLMGMFRWVRDGKVRFYELIAIEQEGENVFLRIKHFDPGLVGWEERERAHEFLLVRLEGEEALFLELVEPRADFAGDAHRRAEAQRPSGSGQVREGRPEPRWAVYRRERPDRLVSYFMDENGGMTDTGLFEYTRR